MDKNRGQKKIFPSFCDKDVFKKFLKKRKNAKKDLDTIKKFCGLFRGEVMMYGGNSIHRLKDLESWIHAANCRQKVSLWEREGEKEILRTIAVEGRPGIGFEIEPTYVIHISKEKVQYLWCLKAGVNTYMSDAVRALVQTICYLHPGVKSLHTLDTAYVTVPGIPSLRKVFCSYMEEIGRKYSYGELWDAFGSKMPVRGYSLKRFLRSNKLYIPGLETTHQFICIDRLNKILSIRFTKKEFQEKKASILFLLWNFALGVGMDKDAVISFLYGYTGRMGYAVSESDILLAYPKKDYRFTNAKIVDMLGNCAKKYFAVKEKETKKKKQDFTGHIILLANAGISIRVIALALHISTSKVKRIRSQKVKEGLIRPRKEKIAAA